MIAVVVFCLRVMTWNVGYFTPLPDKNMREVDCQSAASLIVKSEAQVVVLQELGSLKMGEMIAEQVQKDSKKGWRFTGVKTGLGNQVIGVVTCFEVKETTGLIAGKRKMLGVKLRDDRGGDFMVVGLHAPHPIRRGKDNTFSYVKAGFELAKREGEGRSLVIGDLNVDFDVEGGEVADFYKELLVGFEDVTAGLGETYYMGKRLDYVFSEKALGWQSLYGDSGMIDLGDDWPSFWAVPGPRDHRPVVLTFLLSGEAPFSREGRR